MLCSACEQVLLITVWMGVCAYGVLCVGRHRGHFGKVQVVGLAFGFAKTAAAAVIRTV